MVIYIHGFGSSGEGSKAKKFREYFHSLGEGFIAPSLSYVPELAVDTLEELVLSYKEDVYLIGSSLGGYFALYLSRLPQVKKTVVINPSVYPYNTLSKMIGHAKNYYDQSSYDWYASHVEMLKKYDTVPENKKNVLVLLQKGDEVLDYKEAVLKLEGCDIIAEEGGDHGFVGIERYFEKVKEFFV
ncbi:esterase [bacterium]|nr:esterase [bacterium]MBU1884917.1 esterase [bacterium]